jgi:hypothetical protein
MKFVNCRINRGYLKALGMHDLSASSQRSLRLGSLKEMHPKINRRDAENAEITQRRQQTNEDHSINGFVVVAR